VFRGVVIKEVAEWPVELRRTCCVMHFTFTGSFTNSYVLEEFRVEFMVVLGEDFENLYT
jgi:hypothetical protein